MLSLEALTDSQKNIIKKMHILHVLHQFTRFLSFKATELQLENSLSTNSKIDLWLSFFSITPWTSPITFLFFHSVPKQKWPLKILTVIPGVNLYCPNEPTNEKYKASVSTLFGLLNESIWSPNSFRRFLRAALWKSLRLSSCFTAAAAALRAVKEIAIDS